MGLHQAPIAKGKPLLDILLIQEKKPGTMLSAIHKDSLDPAGPLDCVGRGESYAGTLAASFGKGIHSE